MSVALSTLQILSFSINAAIHPDSVTQIRNSINFLTNKLLESQRLLEKIARNCCGDNKTDEMLLAALYAEFNDNIDLLPSFENLFGLNSMYSKKEVFISLTDRINEKVSALQIKLKKFSNISKKTMEKKIAELSGKYFENEKQICELESKVRAINDFEIRHLMHEKKFLKTLTLKSQAKVSWTSQKPFLKRKTLVSFVMKMGGFRK
jgi:hypothetical protein